MIKTTWGNSLTQVGSVWQNEGEIGGELHQLDTRTLKSSLRRSSLLRGGRRGGGESSQVEQGKERVWISICGECDGGKEEIGMENRWGPSCPVCRYREIAPGRAV